MAHSSPWTEHTFTFTNPINNSPSQTRYLAAGPANGPLLIFVHGWIGIAETWKPQLITFASLGFRVIAPDGRGYGGSTVTDEVSDYRTEVHNGDMLKLLEHLGRDKAVWIGHDWGAPVVWAFVAHHPEKVVAVCGMCVPYRTIEYGLEHLASLGDEKLYPKPEFPHAQFDYMSFHNTHHDEMAKQLDKNPVAVQKLLFMPGDPSHAGQPFPTSMTTQLGGLFPGDIPDVPVEMTILKNHPEVLEKLADTIARHGSGPPNNYYRNFQANKEYLSRSANGGVLEFPALFVHAKWDFVCETVTNEKFVREMREYCTDLSEVTIEAGHWVALEKAEETNAALARWLVEKVAPLDGGWPESKLVQMGKKKSGSGPNL